MDRMLNKFISDLLSSLGVPVHRVPIPSPDLDWVDQGLRRDILGITDMTTRINTLAARYEPNTVYHYKDEFLLHYISARLPEGDYVFLGPILLEEMTSQKFERMFQELRLPERVWEPMRNFYCNICIFPMENMFIRILDVIADTVYGSGNYKSVHGDAGIFAEWRETYGEESVVPESPFINVQHIERRYEVESALLSAVSSGAEDTAMKLMTRLLEIGIPPRMKDRLRDTKDLVIAMNCLLRKTVEQAGVHPVQIDYRSNNNVIRVEQAASIDQCIALAQRIVQGYCEMVREVGIRAKSLPIRTVISRVNGELTADLRLKTLANELNVSASYLSTLFRRETGMSLTEYVNSRRIDHAKRLLLASELPIKDVAIRCGLSDMYYFSRIFKRLTGVTPRAFRDMRDLYGYQELMGLLPAPTESENRLNHINNQ